MTKSKKEERTVECWTCGYVKESEYCGEAGLRWIRCANKKSKKVSKKEEKDDKGSLHNG